MNDKTRFMLALITPAALVLVLFQVVPILTGANASFRDWTLYDPKRTWVGLANYIHVLRDREFLEIVLPNTFGFMFATVALSLLLGLMIALMLNKRFPGRWLVQSFVLLPLMVAPVIAAIMIRWMFNDQFGVVNAALEGLGLAPISWLTQRWTTFLVILLTDVWLWTPWFGLIPVSSGTDFTCAMSRSSSSAATWSSVVEIPCPNSVCPKTMLAVLSACTTIQLSTASGSGCGPPPNMSSIRGCRFPCAVPCARTDGAAAKPM